MKPERYAIYLVELDPVRGSEMAKTRPAVIVSMDDMNAALETVVVCPLTTRLHPRWRSRIQITCAGRKAEIAVDQIRTVSKLRLRDHLDTLSTGAAAELRRIISEMYGEA